MKIIIIINLLLAIALCIQGWIFVKHRYKEMKRIAESRILYIHILLETIYTYNHDPKLLQKHLQCEMTVKKLLGYGTIEDRCDELFDPKLKINKNDLLMYQLYEEGFSPKELCVLFGLNNLNSFYVKHHRINKKLGKIPSDKSEVQTADAAHAVRQI